MALLELKITFNSLAFNSKFQFVEYSSVYTKEIGLQHNDTKYFCQKKICFLFMKFFCFAADPAVSLAARTQQMLPVLEIVERNERYMEHRGDLKTAA